MSDFQSINEAINKKAGRKLGPSIVVSLSLIALVWFALVTRDAARHQVFETAGKFIQRVESRIEP